MPLLTADPSRLARRRGDAVAIDGSSLGIESGQRFVREPSGLLDGETGSCPAYDGVLP